jgi:hypothetical protein
MNEIVEAWELAQDCCIDINAGIYSKESFIEQVKDLTPEQFNNICREILHLREFYDSSIGAWVTDMKELIKKHPNSFWRLRRINFDAPVKFQTIKNNK